jgi:hypothetical protein
MVFLLLENPSSLCSAPRTSHPKLHVTLLVGFWQYRYMQPNLRILLAPHVHTGAIGDVCIEVIDGL